MVVRAITASMSATHDPEQDHHCADNPRQHDLREPRCQVEQHQRADDSERDCCQKDDKVKHCAISPSQRFTR
jgi:hypothetical protein